MTKNDVPVIIVGGGHAGISTAYQLSQQGIRSEVLEAGLVGIGTDDMLSGTNGPYRSSMITTSFESDAESYVKMIGEDNAELLIHFCNKGADIQKDLAKMVCAEELQELGTIIIGSRITMGWLRDEMEYYPEQYQDTFKEVSGDEIADKFGTRDKAYTGGIWMPGDATIDAKTYIKGLQRESTIAGVYEDHEVLKIREDKDRVVLTYVTAGGKPTQVSADYVVLATNGFFPDNNLKGLIKPRWSYQVAYDDEGQDTPNAWDFVLNYHYWTRQNNKLVIGGEDNNFELKHPRNSRRKKQAMTKLKNWAQKQFPHLKEQEPAEEHSGVFAMTPDEMPIVGNFREGSRIFYNVGCNGMGQSTMTYGAFLLPAIMGYRDLDEEQRAFAKLVSPKRNSLR